MTRDVAIVVVGDEILQGRRTEANAAWLARALQGMGVQLAEVRVVSDAHGALQDALTDLRSPLRTVLVTGGLGPTRDDRTREEVARAFGQKVVRSREALAMVRSAYRKRNIELDPAGEIQGDLPEGAILIPNPAGTAPSFLVMDDGYRVVCMPGVPREMQAIFQATVKGLLASSADAPGIARLFTHGLGESMQEEKMRDLALEDVEFCSLPGPWGVEIQCLVRGESATREERAHAALKLVADRLGDAVVRPPGSTLRQGLLAGLRDKNWQIALAESCTAGMACSELAGEPGASEVLAGGVVAYSNELKKSLLGVSASTLEAHGAVSRETALEMARGVAKICPSGSGIGLAVTGVAGPGGGTEEKPVGLVWIAASWPDGEVAQELRLTGNRDDIRQRAAWRLLGLGWRVVSG
jgi:nicotinamide-nucleotide amidase